MTELTCDNCHETADGVQSAISHVTAWPTHIMSGPVDGEGSTVTISSADADLDEIDEDYWCDDDGDEDDWYDL